MLNIVLVSGIKAESGCKETEIVKNWEKMIVTPIRECDPGFPEVFVH